MILAIDQGTTGTTAVVYDRQGNALRKAYREITQLYPQPGWVEHDPEEIWQTVLESIAESAGPFEGKILAVGITNQRETTILWDKKTGKPLHNAIVWQCRRTMSLCEDLKPHGKGIREKTGLPLDAYFSGTKIRWLLDHLKDLSLEDVLAGTVDSWLIWKLTSGKVHATDPTNASRTMLFDIAKKKWDEPLCRLMGIPREILPEVRESRGDYGLVTSVPVLHGVPIRGVAGDQQASLFGQGCHAAGQIKNTYGTGLFVMMNTGAKRRISQKGLVTTLALDGNGRACYALEGSVFIAGAAIQWLRDELKIIGSAAESQRAAESVPDNGGVYLVPAFVGLGAPHWDMETRGTIVGLTRGSNRGHLIRAALESMAYQTGDVLSAMEEDTGLPCESLVVDGGAAKNDFLLQFQADILGIPVKRFAVSEATSLGAAYLAGLEVGFWKGEEELAGLIRYDTTFLPKLAPPGRRELLAGWGKALRQARTR